MNKLFINIMEFFIILSVMFLIFSFLSYIVLRKFSLNKMFLVIQNKGRGIGNFISSVIGAVTPFCVCTTIPVFTGMLQLGISTDIAISFLFSSPLINISAIILIYFLFGIRFAFYYIISALIFSTIGGLLVYHLRLEKEINEGIKDDFCHSGNDIASFYKDARSFSKKLFKDLFVPLLIGAVIAGVIHNYVPIQLIEYFNRFPAWIVVPAMALIGFPIYSSILVLAPICFSLVDKGMNQGAVITFMMSGAGISLPTAIVLSKILKKDLFVYYLLYTFISYCLIGMFFNILGQGA